MIAELFEWRPTETYDFIFFGFWLSHVPAWQFNRFWEMVRAALKPDGRAFFVDSLATQESTARDHPELNDSGVEERKLNDGRTFNVVKVFHDPDQLSRRLHDLGWNGSIQRSGQFFYYGCVAPTEAGRRGRLRASRRANLSRQSVMIIASPAMALAGSGAKQRYGKRERQRSIE